MNEFNATNGNQKLNLNKMTKKGSMNGGYAFDRRISLIFHRNEVTFEVIHGFSSRRNYSFLCNGHQGSNTTLHKCISDPDQCIISTIYCSVNNVHNHNVYDVHAIINGTNSSQ